MDSMFSTDDSTQKCKNKHQDTILEKLIKVNVVTNKSMNSNNETTNKQLTDNSRPLMIINTSYLKRFGKSTQPETPIYENV